MLIFNISMSENETYGMFAVQNTTRYVFVPQNLVDITSDCNEKPKFGAIIKNKLMDKGLKL